MIRKATTEDVANIIALQESVAREKAIGGYGADSSKDWKKRDLSWTFVAVESERPVGFIYCAPRAYGGECVFTTRSRILEIVDLVVAPDARGQHRGHELVQ